MAQRRLSITEQKAIVEESFRANCSIRKTAIKHMLGLATLTRWRRKYKDGFFNNMNEYKPNQKQQRRSWSLKQKRAIVEESRNNGPTKTAKKYGITESVLYRWRATIKDTVEMVAGMPVDKETAQMMPVKSVMARIYAVGDIRVLLELYKLARDDNEPHDKVFSEIIERVRWGCNYLNGKKEKK